ncbi:hypothetical protein BB558_000833 [Smittium angustum]|uniref:protein-tyrosine-phosphatase n=1 Tax=Smittium angustum TaxID=133377 RepID=A0A2U1IVB1_SMIAN|nr:hypothetical protein BB558_007329 [Smittium angustum]PWA03001.1 hypothetical protein BB558_000833 [Smittium angustum]
MAHQLPAPPQTQPTLPHISARLPSCLSNLSSIQDPFASTDTIDSPSLPLSAPVERFNQKTNFYQSPLPTENRKSFPVDDMFLHTSPTSFGRTDSLDNINQISSPSSAKSFNSLPSRSNKRKFDYDSFFHDENNLFAQRSQDCPSKPISESKSSALDFFNTSTKNTLSFLPLFSNTITSPSTEPTTLSNNHSKYNGFSENNPFGTFSHTKTTTESNNNTQYLYTTNDATNTGTNNDTLIPSILSSSNPLSKNTTPDLSLTNLSQEQDNTSALPSKASIGMPFRFVDHNTIDKLISGKYNHIYDDYTIVDCRFPYEYEGGHISNAHNATKIEDLEKIFFNKEMSAKNSDLSSVSSIDTCQNTSVSKGLFSVSETLAGENKIKKRTAVILHCEYSLKRAPSMAKQLRKLDREFNLSNYPNLHYPEIYVMQGGYSTFFINHKNNCYPQNYVQMNDSNFATDCKKLFGKFERQFKRSKSTSDASLLSKQFHSKTRGIPTPASMCSPTGKVSRKSKSNGNTPAITADPNMYYNNSLQVSSVFGQNHFSASVSLDEAISIRSIGSSNCFFQSPK